MAETQGEILGMESDKFNYNPGFNYNKASAQKPVQSLNLQAVGSRVLFPAGIPRATATPPSRFISDEGIRSSALMLSEVNPFEESFDPMSTLTASPLSLSTPPIGTSFLSLPTLPTPPIRANALKGKSSLSNSLSGVDSPMDFSDSDPHHGLNLLAEAEVHKGKQSDHPKESDAKKTNRKPPKAKATRPIEEKDTELGNQGNGTPDSSKPKRKRVTKDMSAEEKRQIYLARNKAAAQKCRQRKKQWLAETQNKSEILAKQISELRMQLARLKGEQEILRDHISSHQACGGEKFTHFLEEMKKMEQDLINSNIGSEIPIFDTKMPEYDGSDDDGSDDGN